MRRSGKEWEKVGRSEKEREGVGGNEMIVKLFYEKSRPLIHVNN